MTFTLTNRLLISVLVSVLMFTVFATASTTDSTSAQSAALKPPSNVRANGDQGSRSKPRTIVKWDAVSGATGYMVRYGDECFNDNRLCTPAPTSWSTPRLVQSPATQTELVGLSNNTLYRVEVIAVKGSSTRDWSKVNAVFEYTSSKSPKGPVATVPYFGYLPSREFSYAICDYTIPSTNKSRWISDIESGIEAWETNVKWSTTSGNIIKTTRNTKRNCSTIASSTLSEVRFVADYLITTGSCLGFLDYFTGSNTIACACTPTLTNPFTTKISYVTLYLSNNHQWNPGQNLSTEAQCSKLHVFSTHESGHAFGFGGLPNKHATVTESVMRSAVPDKYCKPQPYDTAAMMALYQSR